MGRGSTGAIIALVIFVIFSGLAGWGYYAQYNKVERIEAVEGKQGLRHELRKAEDELAAQKKRLADAEAELAKKKAELDVEFERARAAGKGLQNEEIGQNTALQSKSAAERIKGAIPSTNTEVVGGSQKVIAEFKTRKDNAQRENDNRIKDITKQRGDIIKEIELFRTRVEEEKAKLNSDRTHLRNVHSDQKRRIAELVTREDPDGLPPIGKIIKSDPVHDLAVIDIGSRHGAQTGMRFEVFQVRRGNHRDHKGYVEIKTVYPEVSSCAILVKEVRLPVCPVCGYTGEEPEEAFCPRCTAPGSSQGAQRLNASKIIIRGKQETDPIVAGDLLYNPLFSPTVKRRYAIVGQPLVDKKAYSPEAIAKKLEYYGNQVDEKLSPRTDVLIALRGGEEANRAKQLGVIVVYGWQIFRFLEQ